MDNFDRIIGRPPETPPDPRTTLRQPLISNTPFTRPDRNLGIAADQSDASPTPEFVRQQPAAVQDKNPANNPDDHSATPQPQPLNRPEEQQVPVSPPDTVPAPAQPQPEPTPDDTHRGPEERPARPPISVPLEGTVVVEHAAEEPADRPAPAAANEETAEPPADAGSDEPPTDDPPPSPPAAADDGDNRESETQKDYVTDPKLAELLITNSDLVGPETLDRVLQANVAFNQPTNVIHEDGTSTYDENFGHKRLLEELPAYVTAADQAQVPRDAATELLTHAMESTQYKEYGQSDILAARLTKVIDATAKTGEPLDDDGIARLKGLISTAGSKGAIPMALSSYEAGIKAGLSSEDSAGLVKGYMETANARQIGYKMYQFTNALGTLDVAEVDPALVKEVFRGVEGLHPEFRGDTYDDLKDTLIYACPSQNVTPAELLGAVAERMRAGADAQTALGQAVEGWQTPREELIVPSEVRDRLYVPKPGPLETATLPYRVQRPFEDGMKDLAKLTDANSRRGDRVSEGAWVYDPASETWYSQGGETQPIPGGARHRPSLMYDVSQFSATPYSVHAHPAEYGRGSDKYGFVLPTPADYRAAAALKEVAQDPVPLRSFISHPLGFTEFTYPQDVAKIRSASETFQETRDQFFARFGDEDRLMAVARQMGDEAFAKACVEEINKRLPRGFAIRYYPRGSTIET